MPAPADPPLLSWTDSAARLPVAFAQVREDALLDLDVLARLGGSGLRVLMIASGGCTAAALAASGCVAGLHLVDANPAQIALARLKLHLLAAADPRGRRELLGHAPLAADERAARLGELLAAIGQGADALGPPDVVAGLGPDHAGRYELLFAQLRRELAEVADELAATLALRDPTGQAHRASPGTRLDRALDTAFDRVMALPNLVRLFGAAATQNSREPFARHFAGRTRRALATWPAADSPYLWQMLAGRFPPGGPAHPWLDAAAPGRVPDLTAFVGTMDDALAAVPAGSFDLVHLSNILDWLSAEEARQTLGLAATALRPGGLVFVRQLNSTLDVPSLGGRFEWLPDDAAELHARDRSFFYRSLHLGRRR